MEGPCNNPPPRAFDTPRPTSQVVRLAAAFLPADGMMHQQARWPGQREKRGRALVTALSTANDGEPRPGAVSCLPRPNLARQPRVGGQGLETWLERTNPEHLLTGRRRPCKRLGGGSKKQSVDRPSSRLGVLRPASGARSGGRRRAIKAMRMHDGSRRIFGMVLGGGGDDGRRELLLGEISCEVGRTRFPA
jgi:hypothetical protein